MPANKRITYAYDGVGNRNQTLVTNARTSYSYRPDRQIERFFTGDGSRFTWLYDNAGRNRSQLNSNNTSSTMTFDKADQQTKILHRATGPTTLSFEYQYDPVGNKLQVVESSGDRVTWSYDPSYQLKRDRRSGANAYDNTYTYDPAMNRALKIASGVRTTYAYNTGNQIRRFEDATGITTFSFDQAGNQTLERTPAGVRTTNVWDYENRLVSKRTSTGNQTMIYDPDHHRVQRIDAAGTIDTLWDQENVVIADGPAGAFTSYYIKPEQYGILLGWEEDDGAGSPFYIAWDGQQSVRNVTASGSVFLGSGWFYDAWGVPLTATAQPPFGYVGRLGYASDGYVRRRYRTAQMGVWLSQDPIGAIYGPNLYLFAHNDPLQRFDPSGLKPHDLMDAAPRPPCTYGPDADTYAGYACGLKCAMNIVAYWRGSAGNAKNTAEDEANAMLQILNSEQKRRIADIWPDVEGLPVTEIHEWHQSNRRYHQALRHCIATGLLSIAFDKNAAWCLGWYREFYQYRCAHQVARDTDEAIYNNQQGIACARCRTGFTFFALLSNIREFCYASRDEIINCCRRKLFNGELDSVGGDVQPDKYDWTTVK